MGNRGSGQNSIRDENGKGAFFNLPFMFSNKWQRGSQGTKGCLSRSVTCFPVGQGVVAVSYKTRQNGQRTPVGRPDWAQRGPGRSPRLQGHPGRWGPSLFLLLLSPYTSRHLAGQWPFPALPRQLIRPPDSGKDEAWLVPGSLQKEPALSTLDFSPATLSWDSWPPEL